MADVVSRPILMQPFDCEPPCEPSDDSIPAQHAPFTFPPLAQRPKSSARDGSAEPGINLSSEPAKRGHRRARTSVTAPALPDFKFGAASSEVETASTFPSRPSLSPEDATMSPDRSPRHRRVVTELSGGRPSHLIEGSEQTTLPITIGKPKTFHRHRRSGAVSSQDLSSLGVTREPNPLEKIETGRIAETSTLESPKSPRTVEFSEAVDTIPRPVSTVSSGSESSLSTIKEFQSPAVTPPATECLLIPPPTSSEIVASSNAPADEPSSSSLDLNENFDEDPTLTLTSPRREETEHSFPTDPVTSLPPQPEPTGRTRPALDTSSNVIDLDDLMAGDSGGEDGEDVILSSFQKARKSMHSGGGSSDMLSSTIRHRRAESAPSLPPPVFSFPRLDSSASEKGFRMEDVFEEEEEEEQGKAEKVASSRAQDEPTLSVADSRRLSGHRAIHSSPSLLPPIKFDLSRPGDFKPSKLGVNDDDDNDNDERLEVPRPPFVASDLRPNSTNSSPRWAQSEASSCEPSPRCQPSVDDVPSLISTGSTVEGSTRATLRNMSLRSMEPGMVGSTSSLASSSNHPSRGKRLSIISFSRLMGASKRPMSSAESLQSRGCESAGGLRVPSPPRESGLRKMFKLPLLKHLKKSTP